MKGLMNRKLHSITPFQRGPVRGLRFVYRWTQGSKVSFQDEELFEAFMDPWQKPLFQAFVVLYAAVEAFKK